MTRAYLMPIAEAFDARWKMSYLGSEPCARCLDSVPSAHIRLTASGVSSTLTRRCGIPAQVP
jgi:hypothetical protein